MRSSQQSNLILHAVMTVGDPHRGQAQTKPNILVIMGDDVGWMNVASYGGDIMGVKTPNIDRIGKEGIRLTSISVMPSPNTMVMSGKSLRSWNQPAPTRTPSSST